MKFTMKYIQKEGIEELYGKILAQQEVTTFNAWVNYLIDEDNKQKELAFKTEFEKLEKLETDKKRMLS